MEYVLRAGTLYDVARNLALAHIQPARGQEGLEAEKRIVTADGAVWQSGIRQLDAPPEQAANARFHQYVLRQNGRDAAVASPDYAPGDDPELAGWPVCWLPRVDRAQVCVREERYTLRAQSAACCTLETRAGEEVLSLRHRGWTGGWNITAAERFSPAIVCALFLFCQYMRWESELWVV